MYPFGKHLGITHLKLSLTLLSGHVHRVFLLQSAKHPSGPPKPDLLALHALYLVRADGTTDNAPIRHPAVPIRSSRKAVQNILLESIHDL